LVVARGVWDVITISTGGTLMLGFFVTLLDRLEPIKRARAEVQFTFGFFIRRTSSRIA
jgi:hypothetical protein